VEEGVHVDVEGKDKGKGVDVDVTRALSDDGNEDMPNEERTAGSSSPARPASRASSVGAPGEFRVRRRKRARH